MDRFSVIFLGQLQEGFQETQVATSLSKALKIPEEKALKLLRSDKNITLRRHIDQEKAQRISQQLNQLGIVTIVEDETPPEVHFQAKDVKPLDQRIASKEQLQTDQSPSGEQEPVPNKALADDDEPLEAASFAQYAEPAMSLKESAEPVAVATAKPDTDASSSAAVDAFFAEAEQELALVDDDEPEQEQQTQTEEGAQHTEGSEQETAAAATTGVATKSLGAGFDIHKDRIKAKTPETAKDEGGDETPERESFFDEPVTHPFVFKGSGIEYFKIWIVNTLLSIITLGIYSAWAKVKNRQYLYNNTYLDNHNFNYFANPVRILIGRILLAVLVIGAYVATMFNIGIAGILFFIFYLLFPFFIHQSMRFNLNYTSYRNVRFYFKKSLGQSYIAYLLLPVASAFTLYLLWPFAVYKQKQFLANNAHYGSSSFESDFEPKQFYVIYAMMLGLSILAFIAISIAFGVLIGSSGMMLMMVNEDIATGGFLISFVALYALGLVAYYVLMAFKQYRIRNLVFNHLQLDENRFESQVEFFPWLGITLTNALLIGITLGLFIPFAKVREMNYLSSVTYVHAMESLGNFAEHEHHTDDATGEAAGDILDLDVGFF